MLFLNHIGIYNIHVCRTLYIVLGIFHVMIVLDKYYETLVL